MNKTIGALSLGSGPTLPGFESKGVVLELTIVSYLGEPLLLLILII